MANQPPPYSPPVPPPWFDARAHRRMQRDQMRAQRDQMRYQMRSLRRGSVLGPILLIALGVVFLLLQTGRISHQRFWAWYGHWWPLLLVAAGVVLLAEWAFDQVHLGDPQRPRYRRTMGAGVFTLLLIFGIVGFAANEARLHTNGDRWFYGVSPNEWQFNPDNLNEFFGDKHESDQTLDLAFPDASSLAIVNPRGDVTVSGTSDDSRIHIAVHRQIYTRSDSDADSKAQQLTPVATTEGSALTITMPSLDGARADLVVSVPASAATTVTANHGDIHMNSIKAAVTATANHGDIELSAITGQATAHINSGGSSISAHAMGGGIAIEGHAQDVTLSDISGPVSITGEIFGTTHLGHIAGAIRFHTSRTDLQFARLDGEAEISPHSDLTADQALGPVVVTASNRNITLDRIAGDIAVTDRNGSIDLTAAPSLGNITLEDRNGSIKTILPEHASFAVQADTSNGEIDTDFPLTTQGSENHKSLNGRVGFGGPTLHITTTNSDISIHKGAVLPLPATPPAPPKLTLGPPPPPVPPTLAPRTAKH